MTNSSLEGVNDFALKQSSEMSGESASVFNWAEGYYILDIDINSKVFSPEFTYINSFKAVGSVALPTIYGAAAGISSVKFFRWD